MDRFSRLNNELLLIIIEFLEARLTDLSALNQVSRQLHDLTERLLHKVITVRFQYNNQGWLVPEPRYQSLLIESVLHGRQRYSQFVEELTLQAPLATEYVPVHRCSHDVYDYDEGDVVIYEGDLEYEHWYAFNKFIRSVRLFLAPLKPDGLKTFRWNLATCVPHVMLGPDGLLSLTQTSIQCLSLVTAGGTCSHSRYLLSDIDLSCFPKITDFSWRGMCLNDDAGALGDFLRANHHGLKRLDIDAGKWTEEKDAWATDIHRGEPNFFAFQILEAYCDSFQTLFTSLESLSISGISFESAIEELLHAFNFGSLRSLRLWNCPGAAELLETWINSPLDVNITAFEFVNDSDLEVPEYLPSFTGFFKETRYFQNAFIMVDDNNHWKDICGALLDNHASSLQRLILHDRTIDILEGSPRRGEVCDGDLSDHGKLFEMLRRDDLPLECLGISDNCDYFWQNITLLNNKSHLKILHMRNSRDNTERVIADGEDSSSQSDSNSASADKDRLSPLEQETSVGSVQTEDLEGPNITNNFYLPSDVQPCNGMDKDLGKLAQWAFSPEGLPDLQVLAYGDFSHSGRYQPYTMLLCRDDGCTDFEQEYTFRALKESDVHLMALLDRHKDFLGACAVDNVLKRG